MLRGFQSRKWGARCSTGRTGFFSAFTVARPGAVRGQGCFSSSRPQFGRLRAWHAVQRYPEGVLDEVHTWGYADDEEAFTNVLIFTDGSGTMTNTWPPPSLVTLDGQLLSWDG